MIQVFVIALISFVIGVIVVTFIVFYLRTLYGQQISAQRMQSEYRRELLDATLAAQEEERARIADELHDEVAGMLSTTKLYLSHGSTDPAAERAKVQKASDLVDATVAKLRQISHKLHPAILKGFGLGSAVSELCRQINDSGAIEVVLDTRGTPTLQHGHEQHLYRIIQELLNNTLKHANARNIWIALEQVDGVFGLQYRDDGVGVDQVLLDSPLHDKVGLGLKSIASRIEMMDATVRFTSSPGQGFQVSVTMQNLAPVRRSPKP